MLGAVTGPIGFLYLLTFAVTFAFGNLEGTFTVYLKQHLEPGLSGRQSIAAAGGVFAYIGVLIVVIQGGLIRPLVKKYGGSTAGRGRDWPDGARLFVFPAGSLAVYFADWPDGADLDRQRAERTVAAGISSKRATAQGAALGLSASFDSLARATGPAAAGYLYKNVGATAPYWCAGIVMSLCFVFAWVRRREMITE